MIAYADSSVFIAWFHPDDEFAAVVTPWVQEHVTDFSWNPILRAEVRTTCASSVPPIPALRETPTVPPRAITG